MSLKLVDGKTQAEQNENYAKMLEFMANEVRTAGVPFNGCLVVVFEGHASVRSKTMIGDNFNVLEAVGMCEILKNMFAGTVGRERHDQGPPR